MLYAAAKIILRALFLFIFRIKTVGKENVIDGGAILAGNHSSNWDPVFVAVTCPRSLAFMAKSELFKNKAFGFILKKIGAFPVNRGKGDIGAVKTALTILKDEKLMIMFPEGRRVKRNERTEAKPGVVMLATHSKVPVIPVNISGSFKWMSKITITYGTPIYLDEYYDEKLTIEKMQSLSNSIMANIYSLNAASEVAK